MIEKEIALINKQLESLTAKNFDLEAWKSHTIIFLETHFWQRKYQSQDDQGIEI